MILFDLPISPSLGQLSGRVALKSQNADQIPRPSGSFARISKIPYLNDFLDKSRDDV